MSGGEDFPDPGTTPIDMGAIAMRELFLAYMNAGFTEDQALKLLALTLKNSQGDDDES